MFISLLDYILLHRKFINKWAILIICFLLQGVTEKVVYKVNEENPNTTVAERSVWIESNVYGMSRAIQAFGLQRFKSNSAKAVKGFNYVLSSMYGTNTSSSSGVLSHKKEILKDALKQSNYKAGTLYVQ